MTHYVLRLHSNRDKEHLLYITAAAIDYYEEDKSGSTWIYLRGGNAVNVFESPELIYKLLDLCAAIIPNDTRSE